jgi:hypothetical protein
MRFGFWLAGSSGSVFPAISAPCGTSLIETSPPYKSRSVAQDQVNRCKAR